MDTTLRRAAFYFIASRSILFHRVAQHFILPRRAAFYFIASRSILFYRVAINRI